MIYYISAQIINAIVCFLLGLLVYLKNRHNIINVMFALHCFAITEWSFSFYKMAAASDAASGLFWARALHIGAVLIPAFFLHLNLALLGRIQARKKLLVAIYAFCAIVIILTPTPLLVSHTVESVGFKYFVGPATPFYHLFPLYFVACTIYAFIVLFQGYRRAEGLKKIQLRLLVIASLVGYAGGPGGFYPLYHIPIPYYGFYTICIYGLIVTYSVIRYRLFDIEVILQRAFFFITSIVLAIFFSHAIAYLFIFITNVSYDFKTFFIVSLCFMLGISAALSLRKPIERLTYRLIGHGRAKDYEALATLPTQINGTIRQDVLFELLCNTLSSSLRLSHIGLYTLDKPNGIFKCRVQNARPGEGLPEIFGIGHPLAAYVFQNPTLLELDKLWHDAFYWADTDPHKKDLRAAMDYSPGTSLILPLTFGHHSVAGMLILGKPNNRPGFTSKEIRLLETIRLQASLMLENLSLHDSVAKENRLQVIGAIATSIAHEIHNPLTSISTFIGLLPKNLNNPSFTEKFFAIVPNEITRITEISKGLFTFVNAGEINKSKIFLSELVARAIGILQEKIAKQNVSVETDLGGICDFSADENQILQVLINLLLNAVQASASGGRVLVKARPATLGEIPAVEITVQDFGEGIKAENMEKIFEPFFSTKIYGTGLGLPTCRRIIEQHAGVLSVFSEEGRGAEFSFVLPV